MSLADRLHERHFPKSLDIWEYDSVNEAGGHWKTVQICNNDGVSWPCFTEQMILEEEQKT